MMKIKKLIRLSKANKLFWKEISKNTELLNFFSKNTFAFNKVPKDTIFGLLQLYKIGIIDNTLDIYSDGDEIYDKINANYSQELNNLLNKSDFDLSSYFDINIVVEKYKLLEFNDKFNSLINGNKLNLDLIIESVKTNIINLPEVKDVIIEDKIFVYKIEFYFKDILFLKKFDKLFKRFLFIFSGILAILLLILCLLKLNN